MYICSIRDRGLAFGVSEGEEAMCRICLNKKIYIYTNYISRTRLVYYIVVTCLSCTPWPYDSQRRETACLLLADSQAEDMKSP